MDWNEYINLKANEELKANCKILDNIDLLKYCKEGKTILDIDDEISNDYDYTEPTRNDICHGLILNHLNSYDLMGYLKNRYPEISFREIVTYEVEYNDFK